MGYKLNPRLRGDFGWGRGGGKGSLTTFAASRAKLSPVPPAAPIVPSFLSRGTRGCRPSHRGERKRCQRNPEGHG